MSPRSIEINEEMRSQSRAALVDAARRLFASLGYFNCRIADIAHAAGMSQGNVYWHFTSKEELLKAVLADGFDTLGEIMANAAAGPGSALEKSDALVDNLMEFSRQRGEFNTIMLSLIGHGGDAYFFRLGFDMPTIGAGYSRSVASIIAQGQAEGTISAEGDPLIPTMFFFGLFNGLNLTYGQGWMQIPSDAVRAAVRRLLGLHTFNQSLA